MQLYMVYDAFMKLILLVHSSAVKLNFRKSVRSNYATYTVQFNCEDSRKNETIKRKM